MIEAANRWGVIDDESVAESAGLIGVPLRRDQMQWNRVSTPDAIRQFAIGVGDDNPMWSDGQYSKKTRLGLQLAPPSFLYSVDATIVAPKLPGVQWIYAGTRWRWYESIKVNTIFQVQAQLLKVENKMGNRFGRWVLQTGEITYRDSQGSILCIAEGRVARTPRQRRKEKEKEKELISSSASQLDQYSEKPEIPSVVKPLNRFRRGSQTLLWEQVQVGDEIEKVDEFLTVGRIFSWYTGAQGALHYGGAHRDAVRYRHRHDDYEINHTTGTKDSAARGHFSSQEGKDTGMGGTYDVGLQRIAWVIAFMTDWIGDDAHLAEIDVNVVAPNLVGDTTTISGTVTHKWFDEHAFISVGLVGRNQHDIVTTKGSAIVALSSIQHGQLQLPIFGGDETRWPSSPIKNQTANIT